MRGDPPPPDEIVRAITEELAQAKYRLGTPWWTQVIDFLERAWVRFVEWITAVSEFVGGPLVMALLVGGVLVLMAVVVTANLGKRRARRVDERIRREHEAARGLDPADLEARAATAESDGDHGLAMRLLFQAALVRLDRADLIDLRPGTTSGTVADSLRSPEFTEVVNRFDAVVYGDRPSTARDPDMVREMTASLLGESVR